SSRAAARLACLLTRAPHPAQLESAESAANSEKKSLAPFAELSAFFAFEAKPAKPTQLARSMPARAAVRAVPRSAAKRSQARTLLRNYNGAALVRGETIPWHCGSLLSWLSSASRSTRAR